MGFLIFQLATARHFLGEMLQGHFVHGNYVFLNGDFEQKIVGSSTRGCV